MGINISYSSLTAGPVEPTGEQSIKATNSGLLRTLNLSIWHVGSPAKDAYTFQSSHNTLVITAANQG